MNVHAPNFLDRMNTAESELVELSAFAADLANRLVGGADSLDAAYPVEMAADGIFPEMGDRADRMLRRINAARNSLRRIVDALPPEGPTTLSVANPKYL